MTTRAVRAAAAEIEADLVLHLRSQGRSAAPREREARRQIAELAAQSLWIARAADAELADQAEHIRDEAAALLGRLADLGADRDVMAAQIATRAMLRVLAPAGHA